MKLSMMVVITSWAPKRALSTPAAAPQAAPVPKAVATQSGTSSQAGRPAPAIPTQAVAEVVGGGGGGVQLAGDGPRLQYEQAVGERHPLLELGRDQQHRRAPVTQRDQLPVDALDRPDVDAARRLRREQQARRRRELAA